MLIKEKVDQAKQLLRDLDVDCWITFVRESQLNGDPTLVFLAAGDVTWHSAFIVCKNGRTHALVGLYDQKTVEDTGAYDEVVGYVEGFKEPLQEFLRAEDPGKIALNYSEASEVCDGLTHGMYETMLAVLDEIGMSDRIVSAEGIVSALRERKVPTELEHMRSAIGVTEEIFDAVASFIQPGKTEKEIAAFMSGEVARRGLVPAWDPGHCPAVFTGPDTAGAHYSPTDRTVERGHVLNMDFGVKVEGYCSDLQRTFYVLEEGDSGAPPDVQKGFDTIREAIEQSRLAMKPGAMGRDVDAVARRVLADAGYEEFPHALGHQVGRFSHDGTALLGPEWEKYADRPLQPLEPNMVFTIEPRLTVGGRGVVTVEVMVVVTGKGAEYMSQPQRELYLIK
ncbi:MAG: Xaa-Pro peptidase family protein [Candidatus Latescibacterota bacterium]|jgi:Xaa-Pro aminopeptidase